MARFQRTTKNLAQRIDLQYFQRPHPWRRRRFLLSVSIPALAVAWLGWQGLRWQDRRVFSSPGPLSPAHAPFEQRCELCHTSDTAGFRKHVPDQACLSCHDGPVHNANQTFAPQCSSCHFEHRGEIQLTHVGDKTCTQCHTALKTQTGSPQFRNVSGFGPSGHPEFAAKRLDFTDPGTIKFSHQAHLDLACDACHVPANKIELPAKEEARLGASGSLRPSDSVGATKGAYMGPIKFADHCLACHADKLEFDKRILESVPHDTPEVIHAAVLKHAPAGSALIAELEQALWTDKCTYCHSMKTIEGGLPKVESSAISRRWLLHADFSHAPHKMFACQSCHTGAPTSKLASDVLLPGAANCQQCHRPNNAALSKCSECHSYHDWRIQKAQQSAYDISCLLEKGSIQACRAPSEEKAPKKP